MSNIKIFLVFSMFIFLINVVPAEDIDGNSLANITKVINLYHIQGDNVYVETAIEFSLLKDIRENYFGIQFSPLKFSYTIPIRDREKIIKTICEEEFSPANQISNIEIYCKNNITNYSYNGHFIHINNSQLEEEKKYTIKIEYFLENAIISIGDYHIFRTNFYNGAKNVDMESNIMLPKNTSFPEKVFPQNIQISLDSMAREPQKIIIKLKKPENIWLWYMDTNEIRNKERWFAAIFTTIGTVIGILGGWIISNYKFKEIVKKFYTKKSINLSSKKN